MINELIHIDTHYTRAINLERDVDSKEVLQSYILTTKSVQILERITATFHENIAPRAWTLTAPYGLGKSSFALFLSHLLENDTLETRQLANKILCDNGQLKLAQTITTHLNKAGYCKILLTGSPEPLNSRFIFAMYDAAKLFWKNKKTDPIVKKLFKSRQINLETTDILNLFKTLQQAVIKSGGAGCLCIIDEMGKFLEYNAVNTQIPDIFLLQLLAEWAHKGQQGNLLLLVLMHQDFLQYTKGLEKKQKDEWTKVQGRFESIPFLESNEQTLNLISAAFKNTLSEDEELKIQAKIKLITTVLVKENALSDTLIDSNIFIKCYPLHPLSLLILPVLCQKVAQNKRTIFSYLGSSEVYGFKDRLQHIKRLGDWILPWEIFEYFIRNQPAVTTDHLTRRRWIEVLSALERLGDAPLEESQLLKSIGLFNILGNQGDFKASDNLINLCLPNEKIVKATLDKLMQKSLIKYQKFNFEYRVWQGSDFDLELEIKTVKQQLGRDSLADIMNLRQPLLPLVARKYSIQQGTLRYFEPVYIDRYNYQQIDLTIQIARIIIFFNEQPEDKDLFDQLIKETIQPLTLYLLDQNSEKLRAVITEIQALERIESESQALNSDPVAQKELKDYLDHAQQKETQLLNNLLNISEGNNWFYLGEPIYFKNRQILQQHLSVILEGVYNKSPIIKNEIINRDKPSSQANSARKKLVTLLLSNVHQENLGFDPNTFPAEKSIYKAFFHVTGLHRTHNGVWGLYKPLKNYYNMRDVWEGIDQFTQTSKKSIKLIDLYTYLQQPPYGIKSGVLPLMFIAYYLANQSRLALYEEGIFCPEITLEHFEILLKRPSLFSLESFSMKGVQGDLFHNYLSCLLGKLSDEGTLLDIIKSLAKFIHSLPEYTRHTKNLDKKTLAVRDAFEKTQSPIKLLFEYLPKACGYSAFTDEDLKEDQYSEKFMNTLVTQLKKLKQAYPKLLDNFQQQLEGALQIELTLTRAELRQYIKKNYNGLAQYSFERDGLQAFIKRLQKDTVDDEAWLESIASLLAKVPPHKWRAEHQAQAEYQLIQLSDRLLELFKLHRHQLHKNETILLRLIGEKTRIDQIIQIDDEAITVVDNMVVDLKNNWKNQSKSLQLATLAKMLENLQNK